MIFQVSDFKENHFLDLLDDKYLLIKPTYMKDSAWLKLVGQLNFLYAKALKAITNHTSIREYCLKFFLRENFSYLCRIYSIESRCYILHKYRGYNNYWNLDRESLSHFVVFLKFSFSLILFFISFLIYKQLYYSYYSLPWHLM